MSLSHHTTVNLHQLAINKAAIALYSKLGIREEVLHFDIVPEE